MKTELKELDALLSNVDIQPGSIIVIKGGPGSGKTTLGLQILNNSLNKNKDINVGFISLEVPHKKAIDYARNTYGFNELTEKNKLFFYASKDDVSKAIETQYKRYSPDLSKEFFTSLKNADKEPMKGTFKNIIFIDSLNILIDLVQTSRKKFIYNKKDDKSERSIKTDKNFSPLSLRQIMHIICNTATCGLNDKSSADTIYIFSVEYHPSMFENKVFISESFLCDIEILLTIEPIKENSLKQKSFICGVGYEIEVDKDGNKAFEYRSFLRVVKSRYGKHDSRRCSYDIKSSKGLVFFDTYPGDGQISLFSENERQNEIWREFFQKEIPHHYPALRFEDFKRENLQQTLSLHRRSKYIPDKIDLSLTSLDNYWVSWYNDRWRKTILREMVETSHVFKFYFREKNFNSADAGIDVKINEIHALLTKPKINKNELYDRMKEIIDASRTNEKFMLDENSDVAKANKLTPVSDLAARFARKQASCISNVNEIHFMDSEGFYKKIDVSSQNVPQEMNIIGNNKGMIIQFSDINKVTTRTIITNHSHLEFNVKEINATREQTLIFDLHNCITYRQEYKDAIISQSSNNDVLSAIIDGVIASKSSEVACLYNSIIKEFINCEIDKNISDLIATFSTGGYLNCIVCHYLTDMLDYFLHVDTIEEELNTLVSKDLRNGGKMEAMTKIKQRREKIIRTEAFNVKDLIAEITCELLLELFNNKFLSCNAENGVNLLGSKLSELCKKRDSEMEKKCRWKKHLAFNNDDEINNQFTQLLAEQLFNLSDNNGHILDKIAGILSAGEISLQNPKIIPGQITSIDKYTAIYLFLHFIKERGLRHAWSLQHKSDLRLFGERNSDIIEEFRQYDYVGNRPIHHPDLVFALRNFDEYLSIPYDANISFIVYDKTILDKFYKKLISTKSGQQPNNEQGEKTFYEEYVEAVYNICKMKKKILGGILSEEVTDPDKNKIKSIVNRSILLKHPYTWEEIIAFCQLSTTIMADNKDNSNKSKGSEGHDIYNNPVFLMETKTYDTYLCILLEFIWNSGGDIFSNPAYELHSDINPATENKLRKNLLHAFYLLGLMFYSGCIPEDSTLDPVTFVERYAKKQEKDTIAKKQWVFARHWYSTFIDLLTARTKDTTGSQEKLLWEKIDNNLGIMPIPVSIDMYLDTNNVMEVKHVSCWGDWHFSIFSGSENKNLGIELINKLMSSRNIAERADKCAHIPTTEAFYRMYGKNNCISIPERDDNNKLPRITYNELRNVFFRNAKSRSQIFDFHHYMRELHALLKYMEHISIRDKVNSKNILAYPEYLMRDIDHKIDEAIRRMKDFRIQSLITH